MTITDAQNIIYEHFTSQDTFSLRTDFTNVFLPIGDESIAIKIAEAALKDFEKNGAIVRIDDATWVLTRPLVQFEQSVKLDGMVAGAIAEVINKYCDKFEDDANRANPLAINESDIINLLKLLSQFEDAIEGEEEEDDDDDSDDE